jgi:fatty acid desaturase
MTPRSRIDDRRAALALALDWAAVAAAIACAARSSSRLVGALAFVVIAGRQVALLNLLHAAAHRSLFRRRALVRSIDWLIGAPIFDSVATYRGPHLEHHEEFARRKPERFAFLHEQLRLPERGPLGRTWIVFVRPLLGWDALQFFRSCAGALQRDRRFALRMAGFWGAALVAAWSLGALRLLTVYWILPLICLYPVFNLWAEITDHFMVAGDGDGRNQRGLFFSLFLKGHDLYHQTHHEHPAVPFYRLKAAFEEAAARGRAGEAVRGAHGLLSCVYREGKGCLLD